MNDYFNGAMGKEDQTRSNASFTNLQDNDADWDDENDSDDQAVLQVDVILKMGGMLRDRYMKGEFSRGTGRQLA